MTVSYVTLYLPGSSQGMQVVEGSQLHLIYVAMGANSVPSAPGQTVRKDPFPQYVDDEELAAALAGVGGGGGTVDSVNGQTGVVVLDADDIGDGAVNKAFTLAEKDKLADISPGANLYTDEQVRDVIGATIVAGAGITKTVDDAGDTITIAASGDAAVVTGLSASPTADNAAVIQAAIDAVATAGGGTVIIPKGEWYTGQLRLKTGVLLAGQGWGSRLKLKNGVNSHLIVLDNGQVEQAGLLNIWLDGNKANQTAGNVVHLDNTGYVNSNPLPSLGDPDHLLRRVAVVNGAAHGVYTAGPFSQSHFDGVFAYDADLNNFRIESPDNHLFNCVSARSGKEGFYFASNSNRAVNCKAWLAGRITATEGSGFIVSGVSRIDLVACESQDNRQHGFSLNTTTNLAMAGCRADRNGLGASSTGGVGDGLFCFNVTNSRIDLVAGDRNDGGIKQRWAYNCSTGNNGNIVMLAVGAQQQAAVGNGSFGANSVVTITFGGTIVAQAAQPLPATTQTGTAYTLVAGDAGTAVESNNAAAVTVTVPPNSSVAFPIGTVIEVHQLGAGQVTLAAGSGVTLRSRGGALKTAAQYGVAKLRKRATNEWVVSGDVVV